MATMETRTGHSIIQDQNLNVHYDGVSVGKSNIFKAQKKGGLGLRKALNDISNSASAKPSALQASKKQNSVNLPSHGGEFGAPKTAASVEGKVNVGTKVSEKVQRKALSDLTNLEKQSVLGVSKRSQDKKLSVVTEENLPHSIVQEGFQHNHERCIKAQRKTLDMDHFLKRVGLDNDTSVSLASSTSSAFAHSEKLLLLSPLKHLEMDEETLEMLPGDRSSQWDYKTNLFRKHNSSPSSPHGTAELAKQYMHWNDYKDVPVFALLESPEKPKH